MQNAWKWLQSIAQGFINLWSTHPLTMMLLGGFVVLTIALFVLMRTRLGQIKPLWTCAALSILAHVLLMGYFYSTTFMFSRPTTNQQDIVRLQLVEHASDLSELADDNTERDTSSLPEKSWETPPLAELLEPNKQLPEVGFPPESPEADFDLTKPLELPSQPLLNSDMVEDFQPELLDSADKNPVPLETPREPLDDHPSESLVQAQPIERAVAEVAETQPERSIEGELVLDLPQPEFKMTEAPDLVPIKPKSPADDLERQLRDLAQVVPAAIEIEKRARQIEPVPDELRPEQWRPVKATPAGTTNAGRVPVAPATLVRAGDGKPLPDIYKARTEPKSNQWLALAGGSAETQQAVEAALDFLSNAQEADGRWDASRFGGGLEQHVLGHDRRGAGVQADTAVTSLSVLAMMAAGNTHLQGKHAKSVQHGLEFLLSVQKVDGSLAGEALLFSRMYCHSMATLAISEAYAMTGDKRLHAAVQRAVDFTLRAQNQTDGGWRYQAGDKGDMSQFGWHVMSLKSAKLAGIEVPDASWQRMKVFLNSCSSGQYQGIASYRPGQAPSRVMTAEALVCRYFLETNPSRDTVNEASQIINAAKPGSGLTNYYYWYYGTLAMKLSGGSAWDVWNKAMTEQLLRTQRQEGVLKGSFDANGVWSGYGGRIYSTAMATLCLESYYRYLPEQKSADNR